MPVLTGMMAWTGLVVGPVGEKRLRAGLGQARASTHVADVKEAYSMEEPKGVDKGYMFALSSLVVTQKLPYHIFQFAQKSFCTLQLRA